MKYNMLECIILLLSLLIIAIITYYVNDGDIISPAFLACFSFIVSCIAAIYNCFAWKTGISLSTVFTILLGLACFIVPASYLSRSRVRSVEKTHELEAIDIPKTLTFVVFLFGIVVSVFYVRAILNTVDSSSGDWSSTMQEYRAQVSYGNSEETALPSYVTYMFKLVTAFAYAYLFVFINNLLVKKRIYFEYLFVPILYCGVSLTQASRGQIIIFLFAGIVMYWILKKRISNHNLRIPFSAVVILLLVLVGGLTLFTIAGSLVGRTTVKTPLDSLACYVGGSIIGLDMFLDNPATAASPSNIIGAETFRGIYAYLSGLFGNSNWDYSFQMEYRFVNGVNIGNLYTAFRYYLHDFGYPGMVTLTAFQGVFYGGLYRLLNNRTKFIKLTSLASLLVVFSYLYIAVVYLPLADYLFHQYLNPTTMLSLFMFVCAVFVLCKAGKTEEVKRRI